MDENTYSLIFLLLFVVLLVTGSRRDASASSEGSELNACDRYAIADKCMEEFARYWK